VAGFATAAALFAATPARLFAPQPSCFVLSTGCWSGAAYAYNDLPSGKPLVADTACTLTSLLNFVWCSEYEGCHAPLFATDRGGGYLDAHLMWLYRAVAVPSVRTLVYINGPGALVNFLVAEEVLPCTLVLERIRREFPQAADVDTYLRYLYGSVGYQKALAELGPDWRRRLDEQTFTFPSPGRGPAPRKKPRGAALGAAVSAFTDRAFLMREGALDRLAHLWPLFPPRPRLCRLCENNNRVVTLLDACAARYLDPSNDKPLRRMMRPEDFWACVGGDEVWQAWVNIVAKVCAARRIRLVFYVPPHLHVTAAEYETAFRPQFVDRVRRAFAPYPHVVVIDQARAPGFTTADLAWWDNEGLPIKAGYLFNAVGRLKEARLLLAALLEAGLLDGDDHHCRRLGSAWPAEASFPSGPRSVTYAGEEDRLRVQEVILQPALRLRTTQAAGNASPSAGHLRPVQP
jgi:hypothetical protein